MFRKIVFVCITAILLLTSACSGSPSSNPTPVPTPEIIELYDDPYVPFYTADLAEVVNVSQTIIVGLVEETLPAELVISDDTKYVQTPANIRVIQSLKGKHETGETFIINQAGGVAEGLDFRPASVVFHEDGETYLFFIFDDDCVLHSEKALGNNTLYGYFFSGITIDEAALVIADCMANGKMTIDLQQIKSFCLGINGPDGNLVYYIDKTDLEEQVTLDGTTNPRSKTDNWDTAKWDAFIADLEECGVFNWKRHYEAVSYKDYTYWGVDLEIEIGYLVYQGTDAYPDEWEAFLSIIAAYFGTVESQP